MRRSDEEREGTRRSEEVRAGARRYEEERGGARRHEEEQGGDRFSVGFFALSVPVLTRSNTHPGGLKVHFFCVFLGSKFLLLFSCVFGNIFGPFLEPKWFRKRLPKKSGKKNTKTRNRTTFHQKSLILRPRSVQKRSKNGVKCVPKGLRKQRPKNDPKMSPKRPPKCPQNGPQNDQNWTQIASLGHHGPQRVQKWVPKGKYMLK